MFVRTILAALLLSTPCLAAPLVAPAAVVQVAQAETFDMPEIGLTVQVPAGWKATVKEDNWMISSADGRVALIFQASDNTLQGTLEAFKESQTKRLTDIVSDAPAKPDSINGIPTYDENGTGKMDGIPVLWSIDVLQAKKVVAVYSLIETGAAQANASAIGQLLKSLRAK